MALLVDANVLIDYCDTDPSVLLTYATHINQIVIPSVVLAEVDQLDENTCVQLNMTIVEEPLTLLTEAAGASDALSFEDWICLILCDQNSWKCATNDKRLRRECGQKQVQTIWGLEMMLQLAAQRLLSRNDALNVANALMRTNPYFYNEKILTSFEASLASR